MATAAALREIEEDCPWLLESFRSDLALLSASVAEESRRFAADMQVLARLTAQVPRCPFDERGATPWTSFRREVAVARRLSDRGAAAEIRAAVALTGPMRQTLALLVEGVVAVRQARAFICELEHLDDAIVAAVDAQLADRIATMSIARIRQETRKAVLTADPDDAARRTADANDHRDVQLHPEPDDQASVLITGPAVPLTRWHTSLDRRARALKAAGDPRTLAQLRFDLAVSTYPCTTHPPVDTSSDLRPDPRHDRRPDPRHDAEQVAAAAAVVAAARPDGIPPHDDRLAADTAAAAAGLRPSSVEPASSDCRLSRPVQANITVPVETALGLSNEPAWLDGYGWISAPTCRLLLVDAELRRVCTQSGTGQLVDLDRRDVRPPPTYAGLRHALLDLVLDDITLTDSAGQGEHAHDPSPHLRELVELRDRYDDGPTGTLTRASACQLDHDTPWPAGPTAAWNLVARATRTHQLKHRGWTPLRTPTSTLWLTPAGQLVEVPRHLSPPPAIDPGDDPQLPDPELLALTDLAQLQPPADDDLHPWLTDLPHDDTTWTWLDDEPPF